MKELNFVLNEVPFFRELSPADLAPMIPLFSEKKYKKGSIIFFEGDKGTEFFIIRSGLVKVYSFHDEKEIILDILGEGDYFGEMVLVQREEVRSATVETLEPTVFYVLNYIDFVELLEQHHGLTLKMLIVTMNRLRKANEQIRDLSFLDVRSRIFKAILTLARDYGLANEDGLLINIRLTHKQIADMVGTVRETVTKVLLELQNEDLIYIENRRIIIKDLTLLEQRITY